MIANIKEYGALPIGAEEREILRDSPALCTEAFRRAIDACAGEGGGTVYVPAGIYFTGAIHLKSNICLYLEPGAVIRFSREERDYPLVHTRWEGVEREVYSPQVFGENLENVSISGYGTLDGQGDAWWGLVFSDGLRYPRPRLIHFVNCKGVRIEGVKLVCSPSWTVHPLLCENVTIQNITIQNPPDSPNTDGINPESCRNVHISNCHVDVGDDCITIKSGVEDCPEKIPCENITITNCILVHGHGGVVIGSEMSGGIRNVVISNCVFEGTDRGIRMKSRRGRGGIVEDIRVDNLVMKSVLCPIVLHLFYFCGPKGKDRYVWDKSAYPVNEGTPAFRGIHFSNITARQVRACAGFIYGLPEMPIEEVILSDITVELAENAEPGLPAMMSDLEPMSGRGFICCNVKELSFDRVRIRNQTGPAFEISNGTNVSLPREVRE
jgi:polygalacturonase